MSDHATWLAELRNQAAGSAPFDCAEVTWGQVAALVAALVAVIEAAVALRNGLDLDADAQRVTPVGDHYACTVRAFDAALAVLAAETGGTR